MLKRNAISVLAILLSFYPVLVSSQSIAVKESAEIPDYAFEIFRPSPGSYVAINYGSTHGAFGGSNYKKTVVTGYDSKLNETYSNPFKELQGNKYQGAIELNKQLHVFYADKKDIHTCLLDHTNGQAKGNPKAILTTTNEPTAFYKGFSPDSVWCFVAFACGRFRGKDQLFEGVIMDKKMNVHTKFSFSLEKIKAHIDNTSFVLSPEGVLYVINSVRVKPGKNDYRPFQYNITEINKEGKTVTTYLNDLPTGRLSNMVWTHSKSGLTFTGLLSKTVKEAYVYILSGEFNSWSKKVTNLKESALSSAAFWQQASGEVLLGLKTRGISANAEMVNHFMLEDGAILMVLQPLEINETISANGHSRFTYYAHNVYILKIRPDRELDWMQVIPLAQWELTNLLYSGVKTILYKGKELFVFLHDHTKNTGSLPNQQATFMGPMGGSWSSIQMTSFHINERGNLNRVRVGNKTVDENQFAPHAPFIAYDDEVIYTLYHYRVLGKSTHKIGSLIIN